MRPYGAIDKSMANDFTNHHRRRSIRLPGYDYTQAGAYFLTLCTHNRQCLFGDIVDGAMRLNGLGEIVAEQWRQTGAIRQEITLDFWVVMPNHFHGIVMMGDVTAGAQELRPHDAESMTRSCSHAALHPNPNNRIRQRSPKSLGALIAGFKSAATKYINQWRQSPDAPVWQRNYWEHVVRNETDLQEIRQYIVNNPMSWTADRLYVEAENGRALPCCRFLP